MDILLEATESEGIDHVTKRDKDQTVAVPVRLALP